jgi:phytoene/squalene synthetase
MKLATYIHQEDATQYFNNPKKYHFFIASIIFPLSAKRKHHVTLTCNRQGTTDLLEYNRYCHYVAGLVGEGLSRLFSASQLEDPSVGEDRELSNQMGLFLQKTNIIRDYLEDYVDQRAFWPQE